MDSSRNLNAYKRLKTIIADYKRIALIVAGYNNSRIVKILSAPVFRTTFFVPSHKF